jgi:hypothetical protein
MRELSQSDYRLQVYPTRFSWCIAEAFRLVAIAGFIALFARVLGFW